MTLLTRMIRPTRRSLLRCVVATVALLVLFGTIGTLAEGTEEAEETGETPRKISVIIRNELNVDLDIFWEHEEQERATKGNDATDYEYNHHANRVSQGPVAARGGELVFESFANDLFSYTHDGHRHFLYVPSVPANAMHQQAYLVVTPGNKGEVLVRCSTTTNSRTQVDQTIDISVRPHWSPRGASRFLEMVRDKYLDGTALNRVVPNFLTQFGISANYEMRNVAREANIYDDPSVGIAFEEGTMSFAGSGPDSRTTEIFVVMPGTPQHQLDHFGTNSWETPFAKVLGNIADESHPVGNWFSYGDLPPTGEGPDAGQIYAEDGYEYLEREFPNMDYINSCVVVGEEDNEETQEL